MTRLLALLLLCISTSVARAQTDGTCVPLAERGTRTLGCYITARMELGRIPRDTALYWHIDSFPSIDAAIKAKGSRGTAVQSLGHSWLFTIAAAGWRPGAGTRVAEIGPLPPFAADSFAAVYMEGVFEPGMQSVVHRHPGTEAWYTLVGEQCLETPSGRMVQRAGGPGVLVAGGEPMQLTGTGTVVRRSLVLVLQDATQPRSVPAHDWMPKGLCRQ
ncbi:MAG: hypothetical protein U0132_19440 [Gemmatimonadaceae bacterium]